MAEFTVGDYVKYKNSDNWKIYSIDGDKYTLKRAVFMGAGNFRTEFAKTSKSAITLVKKGLKSMSKESVDEKITKYLSEGLSYEEAIAKYPAFRKAASEMPMPRGWFDQFYKQDLASLKKEKEYREKQEKQQKPNTIRFGSEHEFTEDHLRRMRFLDAVIEIKRAEQAEGKIRQY